ncbi:MAG: hypothetical protein IK140_02165 [Clostridia bacterium]|nr:hypothetical protein [Clostridia bacterium]
MAHYVFQRNNGFGDFDYIRNFETMEITDYKEFAAQVDDRFMAYLDIPYLNSLGFFPIGITSLALRIEPLLLFTPLVRGFRPAAKPRAPRLRGAAPGPRPLTGPMPGLRPAPVQRRASTPRPAPRPAQPGRPVSPLRPGQPAPTVRSPKPASRGQVGKPVPGPLDKGPKGRR